MVDLYEVAVVGAGMFGSAAAKHLSCAGADVVVIGPGEPESDTTVSAIGAYYDEARISRRLGWDRVWGTLDTRSLERFRNIEIESGICFFRECGSLVLMPRSVGEQMSIMLRQCEADGIEIERASDKVIRREFPGLRPPPLAGGTEGLLERKQAGYLNPRRLVEAQLALSEAAGGTLVREVVTAVRKDAEAGLWRLQLGGPGQTGEISAQKVLVATGALTNYNSVLPANVQLALHAFTEPNLLLEVVGEQLARLNRLPTVVTVDPLDSGNANMSMYLVPPIRYPDGKWYMRIGPGMQPIVRELRTADEAVAWYRQQKVTAEQAEFLLAMMRMVLPGLKPASLAVSCCIIEKTVSGYPYIGHINDDESLTVAVGGNGHGGRGSDEIGRLAATLVLGKRWESPIPQEVFRPIPAHAGLTGNRERQKFLSPPFGLS